MILGKKGRLAVCGVVLGLFAGQCGAGVVTYIGEDLQPAGPPTVRTNSDAAAASFSAAAAGLGSSSVINFESAPVGAFNSLVVAPGVTISGTNGSGGQFTINNLPNFPANQSLDGTNTTSGGTQYVEMLGGNLTFTFAQPVQFFGAYLTGVQTSFFSDTINFSDGTSQTITLAGTGTSGSVGETAFVGFTDAGKSISSVTVSTGVGNTGQDFIGVDDVQFETVATPLPSSVWGGMALLGGLGLVNLRRRFLGSRASV